jgi:hypothetical protein
MHLPPIEFLIAHAYRRSMPWAGNVKRLPGAGLWFAWLVGEHVPANDEAFENSEDAHAANAQDTLAP